MMKQKYIYRFDSTNYKILNKNDSFPTEPGNYILLEDIQLDKVVNFTDKNINGQIQIDVTWRNLKAPENVDQDYYFLELEKANNVVKFVKCNDPGVPKDKTSDTRKENDITSTHKRELKEHKLYSTAKVPTIIWDNPNYLPKGPGDLPNTDERDYSANIYVYRFATDISPQNKIFSTTWAESYDGRVVDMDLYGHKINHGNFMIWTSGYQDFNPLDPVYTDPNNLTDKWYVFADSLNSEFNVNDF